MPMLTGAFGIYSVFVSKNNKQNSTSKTAQAKQYKQNSIWLTTACNWKATATWWT